MSFPFCSASCDHCVWDSHGGGGLGRVGGGRSPAPLQTQCSHDGWGILGSPPPFANRMLAWQNSKTCTRISYHIIGLVARKRGPAHRKLGPDRIGAGQNPRAHCLVLRTHLRQSPCAGPGLAGLQHRPPGGLWQWHGTPLGPRASLPQRKDCCRRLHSGRAP